MKRPLEERALAGDAVGVRCLHVGMAARPELVEAEVVDQDDENVRSARHGQPEKVKCGSAAGMSTSGRLSSRVALSIRGSSRPLGYTNSADADHIRSLTRLSRSWEHAILQAVTTGVNAGVRYSCAASATRVNRDSGSPQRAGHDNLLVSSTRELLYQF